MAWHDICVHVDQLCAQTNQTQERNDRPCTIKLSLLIERRLPTKKKKYGKKISPKINNLETSHLKHSFKI